MLITHRGTMMTMIRRSGLSMFGRMSILKTTATRATRAFPMTYLIGCK